MKNIYFKVANEFFIKFTSDSNILLSVDNIILLNAYVPGIKIINHEEEAINYYIEHSESAENKFIQQDNKVIIKEIWGGNITDDFYHLMYGITRLLCLQKDKYIVHGACIQNNNKYILIVGHSGSGKTTVSLKLMQNSDSKLFSGNKTVIEFRDNKIFAESGNSTVTIKESDIEAAQNIKGLRVIEYCGRYAFTLPRENYSSGIRKIDNIIIVRLNDYKNINSELNKLSALHQLYSFFMDSVNADVVMAGASEVLTSEVPHNTKSNLVRELIDSLRDIKVNSITGNSDYIAKEILKL